MTQPMMQPQDGIQSITPEQRLARVEAKVDQILVAIAGGLHQGPGLAARVERLESWGKWLAGIVTAMILTAIGTIGSWYKGAGH
jgi:hypothetical protein